MAGSSAVKKADGDSVVPRLAGYIFKSKGLLFAAVLCAVLSVALNLAGPFFIGKAIDAMAGRGTVDFPRVFRLSALLACMYAFSALFTWLLTYVTNLISYRAVNILRRDLFDHINRLPLSFYDRRAHGDIISRFINDADFVCDGLLQGGSSILTGIVTIVGSIVFMLSINGIMTLVVVLSSFITFFMARFITTRSQKLFGEQAKRLGALNGYVEEMIAGQKTVKAFSYEGRSIEQFQKINQELYGVGVKSQFYGSLTNPSTRFVNNIAYAVIGVIRCFIAVAGHLTVGDISSFLIYSNLFSKPFNEITGVFTQLQSAAASARRVFAILDEVPETADGPGAKVLDGTGGDGTVSFAHVSFSYLPSRPLITDMNLHVEPGMKVAIVGRTGAGKTTLVNLLMRFYEVTGGVISVQGHDITNITRDSLRRNFGMVLQDTFLFEDTVKNNIAYGKDDATDEQIISAAKAAGIDGFIRRLPQGYDTYISGSGTKLSQGQRQLLTITRAMLVDPPMLILDEATSNIDTRTELYIQKAFLKMMEGRTSFIIAHRLSTIRDADVILVMDKGDIVETGRHEELLKQGGLYAEIYNSQFPSPDEMTAHIPA